MAKVTKIGTLIDRYIKLDNGVRDIQAQLEKAKKARADLEERILKDFTKEQIKSARGKSGQLTRTERNVPSISDWTKFCAYVKRHNAFELMQKRVTTEAYRERIDAGKKVPGVTVFTVVKLSISRKGG